jgi:hypothetical protein
VTAAVEVPDLSMWAADAVLKGTDPEVARDELLSAIREGVEGRPRSAQVELGPSEIGHPCRRWLGYRFAGVEGAVPQPVPWRQEVGTAVHDAVDDHLHRYNAIHGFRYLTNLLVEVGELYPGRPIRGRLDILDVPTATVVDLKVPGPTAIKKYGPASVPEKPQYRSQKHLYGRGARRAGFPVERVAILRLPSNGEFSQASYKHEPYDEAIALGALTRAGAVAKLVDAMGVKAIPLLDTTEADCHRCEFYAPKATDLTRACPGDPEMKTQTRKPRRDSLAALTEEE